MTYDTKRDRGGLSESDRELLAGEADFQYQTSEDKARRRVKDRIRNTLLDFPLILDCLADDDLEDILTSSEGQSQRDLERSLASMIGLVYLAARDGDLGFEEFLSWGIQQAVTRDHGGIPNVFVDVEFDLDVEVQLENFKKADIERAIDRIEAGEADALREQERAEVLDLAIAEGLIDTDALREADLERYGTGVSEPWSSDPDPDDSNASEE